MSTTVDDLIAETRRDLYAGARDQMNKLDGALDANDTSATFLYELGSIRSGSYIAVDLEVMYVFAVTNEADKEVVIERGMLGSTAATHADGAVVTVNPKFSDWAIFTAINAELDDLTAPSNGLFAERNVTLTYNPAIMGYDLTDVDDTGGVLEILEVKYDQTGPERLWPEIRRFDLRRLSDTGDFASGTALVLFEEGQSGRDVRVAYTGPYIPFADLGDDIADTGLQDTAHDIPPLGASMRLQSMREGQRNFNEVQGDTRRAAEVPVGAQLAGVRGPAGIRQARIMAERSRLRKRWPYRRRI